MTFAERANDIINDIIASTKAYSLELSDQNRPTNGIYGRAYACALNLGL